jgi:hypothetical protein
VAGIMTCTARHGPVGGQAAVEEQRLAKSDLSRGLSLGIAARVAALGTPTC